MKMKNIKRSIKALKKGIEGKQDKILKSMKKCVEKVGKDWYKKD